MKDICLLRINYDPSPPERFTEKYTNLSKKKKKKQPAIFVTSEKKLPLCPQPLCWTLAMWQAKAIGTGRNSVEFGANYLHLRRPMNRKVLRMHNFRKWSFAKFLRTIGGTASS